MYLMVVKDVLVVLKKVDLIDIAYIMYLLMQGVVFCEEVGDKRWLVVRVFGFIHQRLDMILLRIGC
jgi:hypothetical protein